MKTAIDIENHADLRQFLTRAGRMKDSDLWFARNLPGRASHRVVLVDLPGRNHSWIVKQALDRMRPETERFCDPARSQVEGLALGQLPSLMPPHTVPELVFENQRQNILVMQAVPEPHESWNDLIMAGNCEERHVRQFAKILGTLHAASWRRHAELAQRFENRSFFEALRIEPLLEYSARQAPAAAAFMTDLMAQSRECRTALVHGDFCPKNVLLYGEKLILLDYELMHWGDPAFDAGFAFSHFLVEAHRRPQNGTAMIEAVRIFWKEYFAYVRTSVWARGLETRAVRHGAACLLARAGGLLPHEYLDGREKEQLQRQAIDLMQRPPVSVEALAAQSAAGMQVK